MIFESSLDSLNRSDFPAADTILLVTGKGSFKSCGAEKELLRIFDGCKIRRYSDFETNPRLEDVKKGLEMTPGVDLLLAVGGGSVLDMAKLLKAFSSVDTEPFEYISGRLSLPDAGNLPLVALPTTSGSGSESTHFAVVYKDKVKYSLAHPGLLPGLVVLDPGLTMSMNPYQTACSGFDALAQAVESYWNLNANRESRVYAAEALDLIIKNLLPAVNNPGRENRAAMQKGANLAGQAINITKTTGPHAFCYYLTSRYSVAHGHGAALMLLPFFIYNSRVEDPQVNNVMNELFQLMSVSTGEEASDKLYTMMKSCGLEARLSAILDIENDFEDFYSSVNLERLKNNPRPMDNKEEFKALLL